MRIAIGNDHAGTALKKRLLDHMRASGHSVTDHGAPTEDSVDYPDFAHPVALAVQNGDADLGVLICGSGNGVNMAANKHHGVRSALAWNTEVATLARTHNDANVIALPSRFVDAAEAERILDAFLAAHFEGGRHQRRVAKIEAA
ncbi:MAG: ribose 5-phosphate isomerase B [Flavobacteriales bacterium]